MPHMSPSLADFLLPHGFAVPHPAAVLRGGGEPMAKMRSDLVRAKQALAGAGTTGEAAS